MYFHERTSKYAEVFHQSTGATTGKSRVDINRRLWKWCVHIMNLVLLEIQESEKENTVV